MQQYSTHHQDSSTETAFSANNDFYDVINRWLHLFFYDNCPNPSTIIPGSFYSNLYKFTVSAEEQLQNHSDCSHVMLVIDCKTGNSTRNKSIRRGLMDYLNVLIKDYINAPYISCQVNENTFTILLENYKEIDISVLVIYLTEMISAYHPELRSKLTFGFCKADSSECDVLSLYQKAFYAMNTIKEQDQQLLADYHEIMVKTAAQC